MVPRVLAKAVVNVPVAPCELRMGSPVLESPCPTPLPQHIVYTGMWSAGTEGGGISLEERIPFNPLHSLLFSFSLLPPVLDSHHTYMDVKLEYKKLKLKN